MVGIAALLLRDAVLRVVTHEKLSESVEFLCRFSESANSEIPKIGISHFAIQGTVYGVPVRNFFCTDAVFGGDAFPNFAFRHTSSDLGGPRYVVVRPLVLHEFEDGRLQGGPLVFGWRGFRLWLGPLRADWRPGDPLQRGDPRPPVGDQKLR